MARFGWHGSPRAFKEEGRGGGGGGMGGEAPIFTSNSCDVPQSRDYSTDERDSVYDSTGQLTALLYDLRST